MKYRKDFVTNSSSSSFICEICGRTESGWDMSAREAEMYECVNGHTFCMEEALEVGKEEMYKEIDNYATTSSVPLTDDEIEELNNCEDSSDMIDYAISELDMYEVPECLCPMCQFIEYSQKDMARYLLKKYDISRDKVFEEVKKINKRRKKLYDSEYVTYVCKEYDLNPVEIVAGWKEEFGTYANFNKYLTGRM